MMQAGTPKATPSFLRLAILRAGLLRYAHMPLVPMRVFAFPVLLALLTLNACLDEPGQAA